MILEKITDPFVRAYINSNGGGSGGGGTDTGVVCYAYDNEKEYAETARVPMFMVKLSDEPLVADDYDSAIVVLNDTNYGSQYAYIGGYVTISSIEEAPDVVMLTGANGNPIFMYIPHDPEMVEGFGLPSGGIWLIPDGHSDVYVILNKK